MTQEITAFSADEARRLVAQWRGVAQRLITKQQQHVTDRQWGMADQLAATASCLQSSADELEAILPATPCPHCDGTGHRVGENNGTDIWIEPCVECNGKGKAK